MTSPLVWWRWLRQWRRENLVVDRVGALEHVNDAGEFGPRYAFMTVMSCGIATLGLLQNSVAVIIGAMLISPLMGPIVEMGMSLATFDLRSLRDALKSMVAGIALSLLIAMLIVSVSPLQEPTTEILSRTEPTLFDLLVAVFSGLAGAYATITRKGEAIVGVAIATALMPPLAVAGFGLAIGNTSIAGGAAFLFMTNLLAIALSVTIMARWYGFGAEDSPEQTAWQAVLIVGSFVLLSLPLGVALREISARDAADRTIRARFDAAAREVGGRITTLRVDRNGKMLNVDAVLLTPKHRPRLGPQLERSLQDTLDQPVMVELREVLTADDAEVAMAQVTLSHLRQSVDKLQNAATRDAEAGSQREQAVAAMQQRALLHFGDLDVLADGARARWRLRPSAGLGIAQARRLEADVAGVPAQVVVIPAFQSLPPVAFADDSAELDAAAVVVLQDVAWALSRWQSTTVRVTGFAGGNRTLAQARADAAADWLRNHGIVITEIVAASDGASRRRALRAGQPALRSVQVEPIVP